MGSSADGTCCGDHLFEGDRKRGGVAESGLSETVAYEDDIESGFIGEPALG
jgi:hypothetical protein